MKTTKTIMAVMLLCSVFSSVAFAVDEQPWVRHTIQMGDSSFDGGDGARGKDIDNDGDIDFVVGAEESGVTRLYINPGPASVTGAWQQRTVGTTPDVEDALLVDLDGDGYMDVLSSSEGGTEKLFVQWAPSDGDYLGGTWQQASVPTTVVPDVRWMFAETLGESVVVGGKDPSELGILTPSASTPRDLSTWSYQKLIDVGWVMSIITHDMDGDGDDDILLSDRKAGGTQRGVSWLENGNNWAIHPLGVTNHEVMFITIGDLDGDGYDDVIAPSYNSAGNHLYLHFGDGTGLNWTSIEVDWPPDTGRAKSASLGDMNGDGQLDIVLSMGQANGLSGVNWMEYGISPMETTWLSHEISGVDGIKFDLTQLVDLDGDGDLDVLTTEENTDGWGLGFIWYENPLVPPAAASNPTPADSATGVTANPELTWTIGIGAASHDVYFGTDPTPDAGEFIDNRTGTSYDPGTLLLSTTYYWCIDEVNGAGTTLGPVWSFTTKYPAALPEFGILSAGWGTLYGMPALVSLAEAWLIDEWIPKVAVPDVVTQEKVTAIDNIEAVQLLANVIEVYDPIIALDEVISQDPTGGTVVNLNTTVDITVSKGVEPPVPDPVLGWYLNENSGTTAFNYDGTTAYDGTFVGSPIWQADYISFDGSGADSIENTNVAADINGLAEVTVSVWVKSDSASTDNGFLFDKEPAGSDGGFGMRYDQNGGEGDLNVIKCNIPTTAGNTTLESSVNAQTIDWQHLVMRWQSGSKLQLFINGVLNVPTEDAPARTGTVTGIQKVVLGRGGKDNSNDCWDGGVDAFKIYDVYLTDQEITDLFNLGRE